MSTKEEKEQFVREFPVLAPRKAIPTVADAEQAYEELLAAVLSNKKCSDDCWFCTVETD